LRVSVEPGQRVRFEVEDQGIGIAEADQPHLFEAFYQTAEGAAKGEGTGLGLAISHQFLLLMGSELRVHSVPGQGSRFHFTLTLPEVDGGCLPADGPQARVRALLPGQTRWRILIAEDSAENRTLLHLLLEGLGFEVREAQDGAEAVDQVERWRPHLVWMDMRMPVVDGFEATRRIKALPEGESVVVIALTASAFEEDRDRVLAAGCDDFVRKPFKEHELFEVMAKYLGVRYLYEEPYAATGTAPDGKPDLAALPAELIARLRAAALELDMERCLELLREVEPLDGEAASRLRSVLQQFQFDEFLALLEVH
jgi:CheY-like chemotaxis protein